MALGPFGTRVRGRGLVARRAGRVGEVQSSSSVSSSNSAARGGGRNTRVFAVVDRSDAIAGGTGPARSWAHGGKRGLSPRRRRRGAVILVSYHL